FAAGDGQDVIADFAPGSEYLQIYGFSKADAIVQIGADTLIEIGGGNILLLNVLTTDLNTANLVFLV
ncbi:MAG: glycoside hydrolase, partial [Pseudomonadota bacterium]